MQLCRWVTGGFNLVPVLDAIVTEMKGHRWGSWLTGNNYKFSVLLQAMAHCVVQKGVAREALVPGLESTASTQQSKPDTWGALENAGIVFLSEGTFSAMHYIPFSALLISWCKDVYLKLLLTCINP